VYYQGKKTGKTNFFKVFGGKKSKEYKQGFEEIFTIAIRYVLILASL
jgi:hypothetical protein